jgi:hypothetical protein
MSLLPDLSPVEWCCALLCLGVQAACLSFRKVQPKPLALSLIAMIPASLFAATAFTRFLSWDESYIFYNIVNFPSNHLRDWEMGAFRTSITIWGPVFGALQALTPVTKDVVLVMAKAANWLMGVVIITIIVDQLHRLFFSAFSRGMFHAVLFNAILFLPVTGLALKTFNYDLLSMLLGVLGSLWCAAGLRDGNKRLLFASIITLTLAAQEKLIASPLLWIAMVSCAARYTSRGGARSVSRSLVGMGLLSLQTVLVSVAVVGLSFLLTGAAHCFSTPKFDTPQFLSVYTAALWPLKWLIPFTKAPVSPGMPFFREIPGIASGILLIALVIFLGAVIMRLCWHRFEIGKDPAARLKRMRAWLAWAKLLLASVMTVTGIAATFALSCRIWPHIQAAPGTYIPRITFNDIALYFGCSTGIGHTAAAMAWACAVFINALPTALLALVLAGCVMRIRTLNQETAAGRTVLDVLALMFMTAPLLYGLLQMPLYSRYFNLFLLGTVVTVIPDLLGVRLGKTVYTTIAGGIVMLLLLIENLPFQPLGATFRPIWSNRSDRCRNDPCFGHVTPWYSGWGEELYLAYKRIMQTEDHRPRTITLYHNFPAALIRPPASVSASAMADGFGQREFRYTNNDYYIFSRNGVSCYPYIPFPSGVKPLFTVADRGFVKAWVFRGNDLAAQGFALNERSRR